MYKALEYTQDGNYFCVKLERPEDGRIFWMNVNVDNKYHDVNTDWDQWIFHLDEDEDLIRKGIQEDNDEFDDASSTAICFLEAEGIITQDENANWHLVK